MNIDFQTVTKLPGIENELFDSGHLYAGCCHHSYYSVPDTSLDMQFNWNVETAELRWVSLMFVRFPGVKTFEELRTLFKFLSLPYPENWP